MAIDFKLKKVVIRVLVEDIKTPFRVEFARKSSTRGNAPTLIPVNDGGAQVSARIFVLHPDTLEQAAKDTLWRRETRITGHYSPPARPTANTVLVETAHNLHGV